MLPFKDQGLRLFCHFTGFASVEVGKERSVLFFKIPLWMVLEGIAAATVEGVASTWAGWMFSRNVHKRKFSTGQDFSEYYVNMYR